MEKIITFFGAGMPVEDVATAIVADFNGLSSSPQVTSQATQNNGRVFSNGSIAALKQIVVEQRKAEQAKAAPVADSEVNKEEQK